MGEKNKFMDKITTGVINLIYSKEKRIERYVVFLTLLGFILRTIAALNLGVLADDMVHVSQSAGIMAAKLLSTHSNPALFYYLTDLAFQIFGYTTFASRFFPLIAGTLLIPLVYLITTLLMNDKKVGFFAALFTTFSTFLIRNTFGEASLIVLFFSFFGVYLGMLFLKTRKNIFIVLSGIAFGLGVLTKYNSPFFLAGFLVYAALYLRSKNEKIFSKPNIKSLIILLAIIFLFALPPLVFNYLIYKDLGIMDVYFSRVIQTEATQKLYGGLAGQGNSFFGNLLNPRNYGNKNLPFKTDLVLTLFSISGLSLLVKRKKIRTLYFLLPLFLIPFIMQSAGAPLPKHFVFMPFLLAIPAGYGLKNIIEKINNKNFMIILISLIVVLSLLAIGNSYSTPSNYLTPSAVSQLKTYLNENVEENALIVLDSRIYTSQTFWLATPNNFLSEFRFSEITNFINTLESKYLSGISVYFVECASDDCGWGTISNQPELNASSEFFFDQVKGFANTPVEIFEFDFNGNEFYSKKENKLEYKIYEQVINSNIQTIERYSTLNTFYFAPYLYEDTSRYTFDYETNNTLDKGIEKLAYFIILISMLLALLSFFYILYLLVKS